MLLLKIILITFLVLWLIAMVVAYSYGRVGRRIEKLEMKREIDVSLPPLSVVITAHNQALALRRHLPAILAQDYDRFEVVVVNMGSNDETKDVLERLELQYANLRHTYTPRSARDISLDRLALTLGIRSAAYDWVVLTHPDCEPITSQWLTHIGETIAQPQRGVQSASLKSPDMVLGFARYNRRRTTWYDQKIDFFRLWHNIVGYNFVLSRHAAVRADGCNMAFRKDYFMEQGGFSAHQNLKAGAEELLVNYTSKPDNTALLLTPVATVLQDPMPARRLWKQQRVFYAETRRHQRHHFWYRITQNIRMLMPWLILLIAIAVPVLLALLRQRSDLDINAGTVTLSIFVSLLLVIIYAVLKIVSFNKTAHQLGAPRYYFSMLIFELYLPFWNLSAAIAHRRASQNEFRKKFV